MAKNSDLPQFDDLASLFIVSLNRDTQPFFSLLLSMSSKHLYLLHTEQLIIDGCIAGNRAFQAKLYDLYAPKMLVVCLRYSRNREEAEELLHEGFYRVFKYIHQFKNTGSFEGWVRKIMVNAALQQYKPKSNLYAIIRIDDADIDIPCNIDIHDALHVKELIQLVQALPTSYRMVFNMYVFDGYKHREIAAMLGISTGTSKSNLSDARTILKKALTKREKMIVS